MKAADMITALTVDVFGESFTGIYYMNNSQLVPYTGIFINTTNDLILYREKNKPPLSMKELFATLLENRTLTLRAMNGSDLLEVYGLRIENRKIIL